MKAIKTLVAALVAVAILLGAGAANAKIPGSKMVVNVTDKNANGTVDVAFSGVVRIDLVSNKAKGKWQIVSHNANVMTPVTKEGKYIRDLLQEFEFKALNEGTDQIKLAFVDPSGKTVKSFNVTVRVGPKSENTKPVKP